MSSNKIDDGGLAFPGSRYQQVGTVADHGFSDDDTPTFDQVQHPGMTLRDWFAGQAVRAILPQLNTVERDKIEVARVAAGAAYLVADAMLAARKAGA